MGQALLRKWDAGEIEMPRTFWSKHRFLKWFLLGSSGLVAALGIATVVAVRHAEPFLRSLIVTRLAARFHARVELDSFHISLTHGLRAQGKGLRIWPPANVEGVEVAENRRPLIQLDEFHFRAPLRFPNGKPVHIWTVVLNGLTVDVPPRPHIAHASDTSQPGSTPAVPAGAGPLHFQVDSIVCNGAQVRLDTSDPTKQPLQFDVRTLHVEHVRPSGAMAFDAVLTNPRPRGLIYTTGTMGPWVVEDPGQTPLAGTYRLAHADLGVFRGIAGTLSSTGQYQGSIRNLIVDGSTQTPDFSLRRFGTALPLQTTFHARVDGTDGDTWLEPIDAILGHTHFTARGKVTPVPLTRAQPGKTVGHEIRLAVDVEHGEIADFLRLTSKSGVPLLNGLMQMKTDFDLPPGQNPVHERIRLNGTFRLQDAQFNNRKMQQRIVELSLRGQGKPGQATLAQAVNVRATMEGDFTIAQAQVNLPHLVYIVPGAEIDLHGAYGIDGGSLAFRGTARLHASLSHVVGGWKGWLLTPIQPFFHKDGAGTAIKVHVYGTRRDPLFGVDF